MRMRKLYLLVALLVGFVSLSAQKQKVGDFIESTSYNLDKIGVGRSQQYYPVDGGFVCENGTNRFTRALYGSHTDWRVETSDRPVFALVKKNNHRHLRFLVDGVALDSTDYCRAAYVNGMRIYSLKDHRWGEHAELALQVVALPDSEGAVWLFDDRRFPAPAVFRAELCAIANPKLHRNGDIGADKPGVFEPSPSRDGLVTSEWAGGHETYFVIDSINKVRPVPDALGRQLFGAPASAPPDFRRRRAARTAEESRGHGDVHRPGREFARQDVS